MHYKSIPLSESIKMLQYGLDNKKSIKDICRHFKIGDGFFRKHRMTRVNDPLYPNFINIYNKLLSNGIRTANFVEDQADDFIDKNIPFEGQKVEFILDANDKGILDARGGMHIRTLDQLIKEAKIDLNIWEIEKHVINKWDVTTGGGTTYQNWQVKAWLKKRQEIEDAIKFEDFYADLLNKHKPVNYKPVDYKIKKEKNLLEVCIFDVHVGKLSWNEETGEDYDLKIASQRFAKVVDDLLQRADGFSYERILFVIGNDFFNCDTIINTTTAGTPQDEDTRWQKTFKVGFALLVDAIDKMRQNAIVDVLTIPGNHDQTRAWFAGHSLEAWYKEDKCVNINNTPSLRKYYRYGNNLIGLTHGNEEKEVRLPQLMSWEAKQHWAETDHHEWHCGHWHKKRGVKYKSEMYDEDLGVIVRYMSSISGTDLYHFKKGFVGNAKAAEAYMWSYNNGLIGQFNVNIKI